jgi:RNA polymerase sigma-70 factor (ECF subfamily)
VTRIPRVLEAAAIPALRTDVRESMSVQALYDAHADDVARWVGNLAGPSADRADLVHDVFEIAIKQWPRFRHEAKPTTWLYRIALNVVRNHRRRQSLRRWVLLDDEDPIAAVGPRADDALIGDEERRMVYRVLERLSERQRTLIIMFEIEGRPGAEVAELLDAKLSTVWVSLHRARQAFIRELERVRAEEGRR